MYFTLAVSAATRQACAVLAEAAERTDPRVMPIPGPARVAWRAPGGRAAVLHWGDGDRCDDHSAGTSHAGTFWAGAATAYARTGLTRVDPVYLAETGDAVVVSDRASWAAAVTGRMDDPDPAMIGAFLSLGYPVGAATPFRGVRALGGDRALRLADGRLMVTRTRPEDEPPTGPDRVAAALTEAVRPLGGPDPQTASGPVQAGGHGGELLRGGYAQAAWRTPRTAPGAASALSAAAAAELFRRMTTRRLSLLRRGPARAYLASLAWPAAALARGPLAALDDFYLANRAGRWSAAARQAYLLRSPLSQPLFADQVVRAARAVPLRDRMSDRLHRDVLGMLCPELLGIPLAGSGWHGEPRTPATVLAAPPGPAATDWRRDYGEAVAGFLRGYVLDHAETSPLFGIVRRKAAEHLLRLPQADRHGAWALATLAARLSGDWLNAREPARQALLR